ncbi:MAG: transcriptional repressor NrdR [Clostridia bacterium]|nr:transcriptional repressor NrdR [Clostridia bacterium]MBQ3860720.1 transcriptional repressor NrdR [Clostridia bacterium]MBQ3957000.1 transcriptional repressor NrdR [Clostridia bacterium]MBQ5355130.1 transcriptional repressor NrdR [Clostridia bacterium]
MKCPVCGYEDSKVIDSRPIEENNSIKRRRECLGCRARFTTYEIIDQTNPFVIKKDGSREIFDRNKLLTGLYKACEKRPVNPKEVADWIEAQIQGSMKSEITSNRIGELAMERLKELDPVAYVRFASVHREFKDIDTFMREISELKQEGK